MKKIFSFAALVALGFVPQFVTIAKAEKTVTTTTTTTYYGSRASSDKNNACSGPCDQICKTVTVTITTNGDGQEVTTTVEKDGNGNTLRIDTNVTQATLSKEQYINGTVVKKDGNKTVVTTTTVDED